MSKSYEEFQKIDMRIGTIVKASSVPEAKKSFYKLTIDFGKVIGIKYSAAQITENYTVKDLEGKSIVAVVNLKKEKIANFLSEVLILGVEDSNNSVILLTTDKDAVPGKKIF